jgi:hypothetical protein
VVVAIIRLYIVVHMYIVHTQLLLLYYVQPDDGHHQGRNMYLLAISIIYLINVI